MQMNLYHFFDTFFILVACLDEDNGGETVRLYGGKFGMRGLSNEVSFAGSLVYAC